MLKEFHAFIARGNVIDLAVGVIVGGAFSNITKSLTEDIIMPVIGWICGGFDFSSYFIVLGKIPASYKGNPESYSGLKAAGVSLFGYGEFLTVVINFFILAFIIFLMVRLLGKIAAAKPAAVNEQVALLTEIRDELRNKS